MSAKSSREQPKVVATATPGVAMRLDESQVQSLLPQVIDSLSDAVVVVGRDLRVVAANAQYLRAFETRRRELLGCQCTDAIQCPELTDGADGCACPARETFVTRRPVRRLRSLADPGGVMRRWDASFNPVFGKAGEVTHVVEVWRDVTARGQLEAQLGHSERLAALGTLAAGVGHEINNPLASVLAGVESLERWLQRRTFGEAQLAEASEILALLAREVARCRETTDKLMLLAQPYSMEATWVELNQAVSDTLSLLRYQLRKQGIETVEELDPGLPPVWARASAVRGVCMNLMMNAVQAMPTGGRLTVRTGRTDSTVSLEIGDTGHGIAPEHLDRIWDAFFTTKPVGQGTGLGLSITQRIVARHGGSIRVRSRPGEGAWFSVELPIEGPGGSGV